MEMPEVQQQGGVDGLCLDSTCLRKQEVSHWEAPDHGAPIWRPWCHPGEETHQKRFLVQLFYGGGRTSITA